MPRKLQKGLFFSTVSPNLGHVTRPMNPISLPSTPQNSTSALLFWCPEPHFLIPQNPIWYVPFHLLGYPISPFGVSHFTIWGIFSAHLRTMYSPIFGLPSSFSLQNICVFFASWKIDLAPFCIFVILHFCVFAFCKCETASVRQLKQVSLRSLTRSFDDVPSSKELTLGLPQINLGILSLNRSFVFLCFCVFVFLCFCENKCACL